MYSGNLWKCNLTGSVVSSKGKVFCLSHTMQLKYKPDYFLIDIGMSNFCRIAVISLCMSDRTRLTRQWTEMENPGQCGFLFSSHRYVMYAWQSNWANLCRFSTITRRRNKRLEWTLIFWITFADKELQIPPHCHALSTNFCRTHSVSCTIALSAVWRYCSHRKPCRCIRQLPDSCRMHASCVQRLQLCQTPFRNKLFNPWKVLQEIGGDSLCRRWLYQVYRAESDSENRGPLQFHVRECQTSSMSKNLKKHTMLDSLWMEYTM